MTMSEDNLVARRFLDTAVDFLEGDYLPKIERCLEQLRDEQIWWRANEQSNSIGNLILHLCGNARQWILSGVGSQPGYRNRDAEFEQRELIPRAELLSLLRSTVTDVETTLRTLDPDVVLDYRKIQGHDVDILEAVFHVTEHFSMHAGQIFLLTKLLTATDLRFYEFDTDTPVQRWRSDLSGSS